MSVPQDPNGLFLPTNAKEWEEVLKGTGIPAPAIVWGFGEPRQSWPSDSMSENMSPSYAQAVEGWSRSAPMDRHVINENSAAMLPRKAHRADAARERARRRRR